MLETTYVITWRYGDGSGSGAIAAFMDKPRAERLIEILSADPSLRQYKLEAVAFDRAVAAPFSDAAYCEGREARAHGLDFQSCPYFFNKLGVTQDEFEVSYRAKMNGWTYGWIDANEGKRNEHR